MFRIMRVEQRMPPIPEPELLCNSGLIIPAPDILATLLLVYEKVLLPFTSPATSTQVIALERRKRGYVIIGPDTPKIVKLAFFDNYIMGWDKTYESLFREGVLQRMVVAPPHPYYLSKLWEREDPAVSNLADFLLRMPNKPEAAYSKIAPTGSSPIKVQHYIWQDHLLHFLRADFDTNSMYELTV